MTAPTSPDFPKEEFDERYRRARELMSEHKLDAIFITHESNYIYFTGHRSQQNPIDKIRPYIFVLTRDGDGTLITMPFEVETVQGMTWVTDVRTAGLTGNADLIVDVLKKKGLERARIGAELGREQYLGLSYNEFESIRKGMSSAQFVDAAPALLKLRGRKSAREVAYMRVSAELNARAQKETFEAVRAGMTERDVSRILRTKLASHGGERVTFLIVRSGRPDDGGMISVPTDRKLKKGDTVVLDVGIEYRGYCSDIARTASVGKPSAEISDFYGWLMNTRDICNQLMSAGNTPAQVVTACREEINKRGLEQRGVGRIGHGVGLETTEYPSLAIDEKIAFEPGMVMACNPNFNRPFGFVNSEDNWVITSGAPELLSSPIATNQIEIIADA